MSAENQAIRDITPWLKEEGIEKHVKKLAKALINNQQRTWVHAMAGLAKWQVSCLLPAAYCLPPAACCCLPPLLSDSYSLTPSPLLSDSLSSSTPSPLSLLLLPDSLSLSARRLYAL